MRQVVVPNVVCCPIAFHFVRKDILVIIIVIAVSTALSDMSRFHYVNCFCRLLLFVFFVISFVLSIIIFAVCFLSLVYLECTSSNVDKRISSRMISQWDWYSSNTIKLKELLVVCYNNKALGNSTKYVWHQTEAIS